MTIIAERYSGFAGVLLFRLKNDLFVSGNSKLGFFLGGRAGDVQPSE